MHPKLLATFLRAASRTADAMRPHARGARIKTLSRAVLVCLPPVPASSQPRECVVFALCGLTAVCLRGHVCLRFPVLNWSSRIRKSAVLPRYRPPRQPLTLFLHFYLCPETWADLLQCRPVTVKDMRISSTRRGHGGRTRGSSSSTCVFCSCTFRSAFRRAAPVNLAHCPCIG